MKTKYERLPPKITKCRDYKNFDSKMFEKRLQMTLNKTASYKELQEMFIDVLIEAVFQRCSVKKVFLEISQNSQENARGLQLY